VRWVVVGRAVQYGLSVCIECCVVRRAVGRLRAAGSGLATRAAAALCCAVVGNGCDARSVGDFATEKWRPSPSGEAASLPHWPAWERVLRECEWPQGGDSHDGGGAGSRRCQAAGGVGGCAASAIPGRKPLARCCRASR